MGYTAGSYLKRTHIFRFYLNYIYDNQQQFPNSSAVSLHEMEQLTSRDRTL